jgi:integrase
LFSSQSGTAPIKAAYLAGPKLKLDRLMLQFMREAEQDAKLPDWTNHDIRRTVRSHLSALRIPVEVAEAILAHSVPGIRGTYDRHDYFEEKKAALSKWGERLAHIVEPKPDNVVRLKA